MRTPRLAALSVSPGRASSNHRRTAAVDVSGAAGSGAPSHLELRQTELESFGAVCRLPLAQRSVMTGKVTMLEGLLFDGEGHQRAGLSDETATKLLDQINDLRHDLGWLEIDLVHQHIWPATIAS